MTALDHRLPAQASTFTQLQQFVWRALLTMRRKPEQLLDVTLQPTIFTAMFGLIFGGAMTGGNGDVGAYMPLLIPGIMAQTVITATLATGVQLREDLDKGVSDRLRSLPISRLAPLAGLMCADLVRFFIASTLSLITGYVMGYRPEGGWGIPLALLYIDVCRVVHHLDFCVGGVECLQRARGPGRVHDDPDPLDLSVQRLCRPRHHARLVGGCRERQPVLAHRDRHP